MSNESSELFKPFILRLFKSPLLDVKCIGNYSEPQLQFTAPKHLIREGCYITLSSEGTYVLFFELDRLERSIFLHIPESLIKEELEEFVGKRPKGIDRNSTYLSLVDFGLVSIVQLFKFMVNLLERISFIKSSLLTEIVKEKWKAKVLSKIIEKEIKKFESEEQ